MPKTTMEQLVFSKERNVQHPVIANFISEVLETFKKVRDPLYVSTTPLVNPHLLGELKDPIVIAAGYKELAFWMPIRDPKSTYVALMLIWDDEGYPVSQFFRYGFLAPTGHLVASRWRYQYETIKDLTLDQVVKRALI